MQFHPLATLIAVGALALVPAAQEQPKTTTQPAPPALTVRTTDADIIEGLGQMFGEGVDMPSTELAEGQQLQMTVGADRMPAVSQVQGSGWLDVDIRPAALMAMFKDEIAPFKQMAPFMAAQAMSQQGIGMEDAGKIIDAMFGFPDQLDRLHFAIAANPAETKTLDMTMAIEPKADSWFGKLVADLQPNPSGVRMLPGDSAPFLAAIDVDLSRALPHLEPLMDHLTGMTIKDDKQREQAIAVMHDFYDSLSGAASLAVDPAHGMCWLGGLADPGKALDLLHSDRYAQVLAMSRNMPMVKDVKIDMNAMTYRDVSVMSQSLTLDPSATQPGVSADVPTTSLYAVVGDCLVVDQASIEDSRMKSIIDAMLDQKLPKKKLGDGVLMTMDGRLKEAVSAMVESQSLPMSEEDEKELPENAHMKITKQGNGLRIEVTAK